MGELTPTPKLEGATGLSTSSSQDEPAPAAGHSLDAPSGGTPQTGCFRCSLYMVPSGFHAASREPSTCSLRACMVTGVCPEPETNVLESPDPESSPERLPDSSWVGRTHVCSP